MLIGSHTGPLLVMLFGVGLLARAKEIVNKRPITIITDGAPNFHDAFTKSSIL